MKDSKKFGGLLTKEFNRLKRAHGRQEPVHYDEPVRALVHACLAESALEEEVAKLHEEIHRHFVDLNDLRVCRREEMLDIMGSWIPEEKKRDTAGRLTTLLNSIFNRWDKMSLEELREMGKREARKEIESLEGADAYLTAYCMLTALDAHAVPLTERMIAYLREQGLVDPEASDADILAFVERHVAAKDAMLFYQLLRREAEHPSAPAEKAKPAQAATGKSSADKKAAEKKTVKKKTVQKKTKTKKKTAKRSS